MKPSLLLHKHPSVRNDNNNNKQRKKQTATTSKKARNVTQQRAQKNSMRTIATGVCFSELKSIMNIYSFV